MFIAFAVKRIIAAAALAVIMCTAIAQEPPRSSIVTTSDAPSNDAAIELLKASVGMDVVMVQAGIHYGNWPMTNKNAQDGQKQLDEQIGDALKSAAGHPDLVAAVKAYYIAAHAYFENAWTDPTTPALVVDSNATRLKSDMDSKASAMMLEAKLAWQ